MNISLVIPLLNEQESLPELSKWIEKVMTSHNFSYEVLFIDDGSTDASWQTILDLQKDNSNIKGIKFLRNYGKSQALHAGFAKALGDAESNTATVGMPMPACCAWRRTVCNNQYST